mgnify:CR=1 FL=1
MLLLPAYLACSMSSNVAMLLVGVGHVRACRSSPISSLRSPPRLLKLSVAGVCQLAASSFRFRTPNPFARIFAICSGVLGPFASWAWAVSQDEESFSFVRSAHVGRSKTIPLRIEPEIGQIPENPVDASGNKGSDVLHKDETRLHLANDTCHFPPKPGFLSVDPCALSGQADVGARKPARDEIHRSTPRLAVEGSDVVPHRKHREDAVSLPCE